MIFLPLGKRRTQGTQIVRHREVATMKTSATNRLVTPACIALALWAALAAPARADDALRTELAAIAKGIAEAVKGLGHEAIAVGEFTGPAQFASSGGPVITKTLTEELPKNGVAVKRVAA